MQFIKKLVILTGNGARGTLMLEKNGYGVWCKLSLFDLRPYDGYRLVIISGESLFVMKIGATRDQTINFELGELEFEEIHVAVISEKVVMYGSNCAAKLSAETIMRRVNSYEKKTQKEQSFITFSDKDKKIDDYFKRIAPPLYNDFAIAEKNYYPAYVSIVGQDELAAATVVEENKNVQKKTKKESLKTNREDKVAAQKSDDDKKTFAEVNMSKNLMPYQLERKYLSLIETAATLVNGANQKTENESEIELKSQVKPVVEDVQKPPLSLTVGEKPEVIAMARRITLRDYRVEGVKKTGRQATFFERSSNQLEKLMSSNERFTAVERLIPGSKFVKINYDQKRYYIVGVIGRDYICYGVPSVYSEIPPEPLNGYARWLPFNADKPQGEGFWMMYQDGVSGETLKS